MKGKHNIKACSIFSFVHHKGGTGKTTSCLNIAGWLNRMKQRVLVVDLDPQGNATAGLGVDLRCVDVTLQDVLIDKYKLHDAVLETKSGIFLIPASLSLLNLESVNGTYYVDSFATSAIKPTSKYLKKQIQSLAKHFDYIFIDPPPGSGFLMTQSIYFADQLIVPVDSGVFGFEALQTLKVILKHVEKNFEAAPIISRVLLKNFSASVNDYAFTKQINQWLNDFFQNLDIEAITHLVPFSKKVPKAQIAGVPVSDYAPFSKVARVYKQIAKAIMLGETK